MERLTSEIETLASAVAQHLASPGRHISPTRFASPIPRHHFESLVSAISRRLQSPPSRCPLQTFASILSDRLASPTRAALAKSPDLDVSKIDAELLASQIARRLALVEDATKSPEGTQETLASAIVERFGGAAVTGSAYEIDSLASRVASLLTRRATPASLRPGTLPSDTVDVSNVLKKEEPTEGKTNKEPKAGK